MDGCACCNMQDSAYSCIIFSQLCVLQHELVHNIVWSCKLEWPNVWVQAQMPQSAENWPLKSRTSCALNCNSVHYCNCYPLLQLLSCCCWHVSWILLSSLASLQPTMFIFSFDPDHCFVKCHASNKFFFMDKLDRWPVLVPKLVSYLSYTTTFYFSCS